MSLSITKLGQFYDSKICEYHIEPDGTIWEPIFFHNNPSQNLFVSTDDFANGIYKNGNLFFNFTRCNELTSWEILVIQATEKNSIPIKLRWVQTQNPLGTTFANVAAAKITKNTSTGYTNFSHGGLVRGNASGNTYLTVNNGTSGNWWGATGSFTPYQGGIPGFNGIVVKTGYIKAFIRVVDNNARFYKNNIQINNNFYEY